MTTKAAGATRRVSGCHPPQACFIRLRQRQLKAVRSVEETKAARRRNQTEFILAVSQRTTNATAIEQRTPKSLKRCHEEDLSPGSQHANPCSSHRARTPPRQRENAIAVDAHHHLLMPFKDTTGSVVTDELPYYSYIDASSLFLPRPKRRQTCRIDSRNEAPIVLATKSLCTIYEYASVT